NTVSMFPIGSLVRLSSNEVARVISVNKLRPVRPIVEVIEDSEGRKLKTPLRINLGEEPLLYITKPIVET
ncbi:MAG: HD family phosphohydrolase, partial [Candidatus Marinimicrobia bacterium]|nr:HD family phosphohydrolase [Candidatus Neomarinimicrobiota bacterium]